MKGGPNIVNTKRRVQARKHAERVHTCLCGKECKGNGGWSSHKRVCPTWLEAVATRKTGS